MHSIDSDNKICILRRPADGHTLYIHLDRRTRAAAELLAAWTCVAQTRTQEGAERAKERRRKIQTCAAAQSICAPAGARFSRVAKSWLRPSPIPATIAPPQTLPRCPHASQKESNEKEHMRAQRGLSPSQCKDRSECWSASRWPAASRAQSRRKLAMKPA